MDKQQPVDDQLNSPVAPQAESSPADSLPILSLEEFHWLALERGKATGITHVIL